MTPRHLRWATSNENSADMQAHGTVIVGERHKNAKLTEDQVREIRSLKGKKSLTQIAKQFGVSYGHVGYILRKKVWAWLT